MKFIKYILLSFFILFLSILFIVMGFLLFFDLSKYKGDIEKLLSNQLNRNVEIAGDLDIALYPFFSLDIENIGIYNPAIFEETYFIKIDKINLSLNLFKLIRNKEILIKNISLIEPEINLLTLDNGTTNWMDLIDTFNAHKMNEQKNIEAVKAKDTYVASTNLLIDAVKIKNGTISIKDRKAKQLIFLKDLNVGLNNLGKGRDGTYNFSSLLTFNNNRCNLEGKGSFETDKEIISLVNNSLTIGNIKINNNTVENVFLLFNGKFNVKTGTAQFDDININYKSLKAHLKDIYITSKTKEASVEGYLYIKDEYNNKDFQFKTHVTYKDSVIQLPDLSLVYGDLKGSGNVKLSFMETIDVTYNIKCDNINMNYLRTSEKKEKSGGNANNVQHIINVMQSIKHLKESKINNFRLVGDIAVNKVIFDNKTFNNVTLHTNLGENSLTNEATFKYKNAAVTSRISFEKNKSGEFVFAVHAFANTFYLHEILKKKTASFDVLNKPSLELVLTLSKDSITLNKLTFTTQLDNTYPAKINVLGRFNIHDGSLYLNASEITFNKSNCNVVFRSNVKDMLQNIYGTLAGNVSLSDIVYFMRASEKVDVKEKISLNAKYNMNLSSNLFNIDDFQLTYRNTHLLGSLSGNIKKSTNLNVELSADYVNADDIMGIYSLFSAKRGNVKDRNSASTNEDNLKEKEQAKGNGNVHILLTVDKFIFDKIAVDNIRFNGIGAEHKYSLDVDANFYKGKFDGLLKIDTNNDTPLFDFKGDLKGFVVEHLLVDLINKPIITGVGNVDVQLESSGIDAEEIINKLNGKIVVNMNNGTLHGLNIGFILRNIFSLANVGDFVVNKTSQDFTGLDAAINVENGIFYNNDLFIHSPIFTIRGDGVINIPKNNLDYKIYLSLLRPAFDNSTDQEDNVIYEKILNKEIPIRYYGPIYKPKQDIDYRGFIEEAFGRDLIKGLEPIQEKIDKFIKDLF